MSGQVESKARLVPKLYTTKETCELLSISRDRLQTFVNNGLIVQIREGNWVRYSEQEIDRFILNLHRRAMHLEPLTMAEYLTREGASA